MVNRRRGARARSFTVRGARLVLAATPAAVLLLFVTALVVIRTSGDWGAPRSALAAALAAIPTPQPTTLAQPSVADPSPTPSATARVTPSPVPAATSQPIRSVVALGDSVPAGTNCNCTPYVDVVAANLGRAQGTTVTPANDAVPGETSQGLLATLARADVRRDVRHADLVVLEIGANDFDSSLVTDGSCTSAACYRDDLAALRATLDSILDTVRGLAGQDTQIVVTGYWNVFLDGAVGREQGQDYVENSDALTRATNEAIEVEAQLHQALYVDLYEPFKGDGSKDDTSLLAADGDHPSAQGHRVIASAITQAVTVG